MPFRLPLRLPLRLRFLSWGVQPFPLLLRLLRLFRLSFVFPLFLVVVFQPRVPLPFLFLSALFQLRSFAALAFQELKLEPTHVLVNAKEQ